MKLGLGEKHLMVVLLCVPTCIACGNGSGGGGGGGGGGSSTTTTTSGPYPQTPDGAWHVSMTQPDPTTCQIAAHTDDVGQVDASQKISVVTDGVQGAEVSCTVSGTSTFSIAALATLDDKTLVINIPSITPQASKASPVTGSVSYESMHTATPYAGNCSFYFEQAPPETVATGKVWVAFTCPGLTSGASVSTCPVDQGYALFENCLAGTP